MNLDTTRLPFGGEAILLSRMRKVAPKMVVISLLPARFRFTVEPYAFIRAIPGKNYDWRFLKKLETMVVCKQEHFTGGFFEQICREASPVRAWLIDERKGTDVHYWPTPESVEREDSRTWEWQLNFHPFIDCQNRDCGSWVDSCVKEVGYVQHHS